MAISNPKLYDDEVLVPRESRRTGAANRRGLATTRLVWPLTAFVRSVGLTCATILDAISGRFDR